MRHQTFANIFQTFGGGSRGRPVCWSLCFGKESPGFFCPLCLQSGFFRLLTRLQKVARGLDVTVFFDLPYSKKKKPISFYINVRDLSSLFRGDTGIFLNHLTDQVGKRWQKDSSTSLDRSLNCLWVSKQCCLIHGLLAGWETTPQCGERLQEKPADIFVLVQSFCLYETHECLFVLISGKSICLSVCVCVCD